jgi:selenocysteine lyase/cysteine desulfurase
MPWARSPHLCTRKDTQRRQSTSTPHETTLVRTSVCLVRTSTDKKLVMGSSTTQLFRNLSFALSFPAGSELVVTRLFLFALPKKDTNFLQLSGIDHEACIAPWVALAERQNLTIKWWLPKTKENPKLEATDLKDLLSEKTVLVTCTHASNILGTIHDIKAIAEAVHTVPGAFLCVDAVAYAPHRQVDVTALGVDFYAFSWYKVCIPVSSATLY